MEKIPTYREEGYVRKGGKGTNIRPDSAWPSMRRSRGKHGFCTRAPGSSVADALTLTSGLQLWNHTLLCWAPPSLQSRVVAALGKAHRMYCVTAPRSAGFSYKMIVLRQDLVILPKLLSVSWSFWVPGLQAPATMSGLFICFFNWVSVLLRVWI